MVKDSQELQVLHLITRFKSGGAEKTVQRTLKAINNAGGEIRAGLHLGTGAEYEEKELEDVRAMGVKTKIFDSLRHYNLFTAPIAVIAVAWYLYNNDIDVLHTHSTEAGIIGRISAAIVGTEVVIHEIHGDPIAEDRNILLNRFIFLLERLCAPLTSVFVAKSKNIRETYLSRGIGKEEKYRTIPHGIEVEEFKGINGQQPTDSTTILYVGRIASGKGLEDLIEAVSQVEYEELDVLIAGKGPDQSRLESIVNEKGLTNTIEFLGYREDIPELMATADALVLPSYREGTPRVISEALAAGTPVLSTEISGIPDQVRDGETGVLIEPGDIDALKRNINHIYNNPTIWMEMGEEAKTDVEKYRIGKVQESWIRLYAEIYESIR